MPVLASFFRSSVAYLTNAFRVQTGQPRFESGKFAGSLALRVENTTTNLLSANQSNVETDTSGFTAFNGATVTRDTTEKYEGAASLKCTTGTSANAGFQVAISTSAQGTYIGRCRVKNTGGAPDVHVFVRILYSDASIDDSAHTEVTPSSSFVDVVTAPVTSNPAKTVSTVALRIQRAVGTANIVYYTDALQLEQLAYATTWHVGGGTRLGEVVIAPGAELYDPGAGTIESWVFLESNAVSSHQTLVDTRQPAEAFAINNRLVVSFLNNDLIVRYWDGSTTRTLNGGTLSLNTWTHIAVTWSSAGVTVYRNGAQIVTNVNAPVLTQATKLGIGSALNTTQALNGLIGGLRFTKARARSSAEILAAYNSNVQFTEDGDDTKVFSFNGTTRSLLPPGTIQFTTESSFVLPAAVSATTTASNYSAANMVDFEFPLLPHRTTNLNQTTLTFDFGDVVTLRAIFVALVNWEGFQLSTSFDNVTFTDVAGSPFFCVKDEVDQYRKWGQALVAQGRYVRIIIPSQRTDADATYYETPLVVFASDLNALRANPSWGAQFGIDFNYETATAGGHDELQALGKQYATLQVRGEIERGKENEWLQLSALGNHQKILLFQNLGKSQEVYLMRSDGRASWEEQSGYTVFSLTFKEHIN